MAGFNNIYITTAGAKLAVKTLEGKKLAFSVARLGNGTLSDSSVDAIKAKTELENSVMEIEITGAKQTSETQATISFVLKNSEASSPFYFRELGIFAVDPDTENEVLFAYAYAGDEAEYINNSVSEIVEKVINIVVTVDNASEVTIILDSDQVYVTERELEDYAKKDDLEDYAKKDDLEDYAKKDDLEDYAKKDDLEDYAKKDDLEDYAKKDDLEDYAKSEELELSELLPKNAGAHNSVYRGKDITELFYDGTLSSQIAAGTFDDVFVGDYIVGKNSNRKYIVADIDYRLHCGDTECTTHHVLMIPELSMGTAQMNSSATTDGAYYSSEMHNTNLETYRETIRNDFETSHILTHREYFQNTVTNGYSTGGGWCDSDIDLMNECMVYGSYIMAPGTHNQGGTSVTVPSRYTIDKSQLSLFRLRPDLIVAYNDSNSRQYYWLRDVVSSASFAFVYSYGYAYNYYASVSAGVRPAFLIY